MKRQNCRVWELTENAIQHNYIYTFADIEYKDKLFVLTFQSYSLVS